MASGRWTVVTGASSGIGLELARAFAADGDGVVLVARRKERLEALAAEVAAKHAVPTRALALDLEDPAAPARLVETLAAENITLHTLVNNAGFGLLGPFATLPAERQIAMLQVNVVALTALARLVLPGLIERRRGGILNVASLAAYQAGPYMAIYYASKAFVLSLSEALHEETKRRGVTVTALCPGPVETEFQEVAGIRSLGALKWGLVSPQDVARAGLEGYRAGHAVVIPGAAGKLGALGARLLPRALTRRVAGRLQERR